MILICQNLRNYLQHPNEYIRGVTLRFLCKIHEEDILEPLIPSILACLDHRHSYVRRNAVLAINELYKLPKGEVLLHDAAELVHKMMAGEQDQSARRNAFMLLCNHKQEGAVEYLMDAGEACANWGELMQFAALELIRKVCRQNPGEKGRFIKVILSLLNSSSTAVIYECAVTLVTLSHAPTAIKAAANCFCQLLASQSDNNVKLIVLDRLQELKDMHPGVMQGLVMDVLRALSSPNMDIREKTLAIAMDLITPRNIDEVVLLLKKEVVKTSGREVDKGAEYRQILVQAIHSCALRFPDVAGQVVFLLMDFLTDAGGNSAIDVVHFIREIAETNPSLRLSIMERLRDSFASIRASRVCTCALWMLGEYSSSQEDIKEALQTIQSALGPLPLLSESSADPTMPDPMSPLATSPLAPTVRVRPVVLADGTYATQAAMVEQSPLPDSAVIGGGQYSARSMLLQGDFFLGSALAVTLAKLVFKMRKAGVEEELLNSKTAEVLLAIVSIIRLGEAGGDVLPNPLDADSRARMLCCISFLTHPDEETERVFLEESRQSLALMLRDKAALEASEKKQEEKKTMAQPDDLIDFHHLKYNRGLQSIETEDELASDLARATGLASDAEKGARVNRIVQLSGFSDPVYAEAIMTVHQYDIVLDVTIINRTQATMQDMTLELSTLGDLKLVERPQNNTLAPGAAKVLRANIKVSSTETGVIFGNVTYDTTGHSDRRVVVLNDVHIDIMDYINPASCPDVQFRNMWAEFEWENKVQVNTTITSIKAYLDHIVNSTNMKCLTPPAMLDESCGYVTANLYAKSVFGEDALVNISIEQLPEGKLTGYIRIRSKTQGIALSLGDKITMKQKNLV